MIDTHCHLLPGLDDGPRTMGEATELAARLVEDGVEAVVCTPHYSRRWSVEHADALELARRLEAELEGAGIRLELTVSAEVGPAHALSTPLEQLAARSFGGRFVLVEIQPETPAPFLASVAARLAEAGLLPILAHPERCRAVRQRARLIDAAREAGALVQVVAPSLIGRSGPEVTAAAWRLLDTGRADLLASDAHRPGERRPHLGEAAALVADRLGESVCDELTRSVPLLLLEGRHPAEELDSTPGSRNG